MKFFFFLLLILGLSGCSTLIPKAVEFGQHKVHALPEVKASEREIQRQTVHRLAEKTEETLKAALVEESSSTVLKPATESVVLAHAVKDEYWPADS